MLKQKLVESLNYFGWNEVCSTISPSVVYYEFILIFGWKYFFFSFNILFAAQVL